MRIRRRCWYLLVLALLAVPLGTAAVSTARPGAAAPQSPAASRQPTVPPQARTRHGPPALTPVPRLEQPPRELTPAAWGRFGRPAELGEGATPASEGTVSPPPYTLRGKPAGP